jgi:hypothetical protein
MYWFLDVFFFKFQSSFQRMSFTADGIQQLSTDLHKFPVCGSIDTHMEVLDIFIVPQTGWFFRMYVSPSTITIFADILTCSFGYTIW